MLFGPKCQTTPLNPRHPLLSLSDKQPWGTSTPTIVLPNPANCFFVKFQEKIKKKHPKLADYHINSASNVVKFWTYKALMINILSFFLTEVCICGNCYNVAVFLSIFGRFFSVDNFFGPKSLGLMLFGPKVPDHTLKPETSHLESEW